MDPITGAVVGSLASGLTNKLFGGGQSAAKQSALQTEVFAHNLEAQKRYESDAIQRRIKDAKLAGVSPMAALGMTPTGGASVVGGNFDYQAMGDDNSMGQNVGRAIAAAADPMTRLNQKLLETQIEGQDIDNEYKRSMLARQRGQIGPSMPGTTDDGKPDMMDFTLSDGRSFTGPNQELGQMMENSPAHAVAVIAREWLHGARKIGSSFRRWRNSVKERSARKWAPYRASQRG